MSESNGYHNFDDTIKPQEWRFSWRGERFVARQASTGAKNHYRSAPFANSVIEVNPESGARTVRGNMSAAAGIEAEVTAMCVRKVVGGAPGSKEREQPVAVAEVNAWPPEVSEKVWQWIKENSDLDEKGDLQTLERQRDDLQRRIDELREREARLGNSPAPGAAS